MLQYVQSSNPRGLRLSSSRLTSQEGRWRVMRLRKRSRLLGGLEIIIVVIEDVTPCEYAEILAIPIEELQPVAE